jgi:regulator of sigma E protease
MIHEYGHFIVARKCGIFVEEFAIGMGPKLFGVEKNGTLYSLRLLPLGGFCKMLGEDADVKDDRAFNSKKVSRRILVVLAGAFMNIMLALIVYIFMILFSGFSTTHVLEVVKDSPAAQADIRAGDRIVAINGSRVNISEDIIFSVNKAGIAPIDIVIDRQGELIGKNVVPIKNGSNIILGFSMPYKSGFFQSRQDNADMQKAGFLESIKVGFYNTFSYVKATVSGVIDLITTKVKLSSDQVGGPIGIIAGIDKIYKNNSADSLIERLRLSLMLIFNFAAIISINLGVINLLPLPALDGGRFVFLLIEAVRGKPVPANREGIVHLVGFVFFMALAIFVAYLDILKLMGSS